MPQPPIPANFEEFREVFNRQLSGHICAVQDAKNLRLAQERLAASRARLERAVLAAYSQRQTDEAVKADLQASIERRRKQARKAV